MNHNFTWRNAEMNWQHSFYAHMDSSLWIICLDAKNDVTEATHKFMWK